MRAALTLGAGPASSVAESATRAVRADAGADSVGVFACRAGDTGVGTRKGCESPDGAILATRGPDCWRKRPCLAVCALGGASSRPCPSSARGALRAAPHAAEISRRTGLAESSNCICETARGALKARGCACRTAESCRARQASRALCAKLVAPSRAVLARSQSLSGSKGAWTARVAPSHTRAGSSEAGITSIARGCSRRRKSTNWAGDTQLRRARNDRPGGAGAPAPGLASGGRKRSRAVLCWMCFIKEGTMIDYRRVMIYHKGM